MTQSAFDSRWGFSQLGLSGLSLSSVKWEGNMLIPVLWEVLGKWFKDHFLMCRVAQVEGNGCEGIREEKSVNTTWVIFWVLWIRYRMIFRLRIVTISRPVFWKKELLFTSTPGNLYVGEWFLGLALRSEQCVNPNSKTSFYMWGSFTLFM